MLNVISANEEGERLTYEEILSRFTVNEQHGNTAHCICPNHNDKKASLHITKGMDRVLVHCKACNIDKDSKVTEDILNRVGLELKDLFYENKGFKKTWKENLEQFMSKKINDFYHYTDDKGIYCYTKARFIDKDFRFGVIEQEETFFNMKAVPKNKTGKRVPLLFNIKQLLEVDSGTTVYYVEGEKDVRTMQKQGLLAVTAGGASDWKRSFAKYFKGKEVIILADNDKAGKESAATVQSDLTGIAKSVKVVIPSTREHGDITDFFEDGFTNEDLQVLTEENNEDISVNSTTPSYLYMNNRGNLSINTSLLAEHIRNNSHYHIVKKQGADSFFIYWYEDGYYKEISPNELKAKIKEFIPLEIRKPSFWEDTYKDLVSTDVFLSYNDMNKDEEYINFPNGILDTRTWEFIEHSPNYKHTIQLKCNYNLESAEPTEWLKFIDTLTEGDQQLKDTLQEWMGLNISNYNANICKKSVALYGDVGNTGKSKYLNVMGLIIGLENICGVPIQDLSARFGTGALFGSKCVLIDDQKSTNIEDGSSFKTITGCGPVQVELKGKQPFTMMYRGGITMTCNALPYIKSDKGTHMFDRFLIIPCDNVIPAEQRDKLLLDKLQAELEGITLWALEGLKRLMANGFILTEGEASIQANHKYRYMNDTFFRFINEYYEFSTDGSARVKKTELEDRYIQYCNDNGLTPLEKKNIIDRASANGIKCKKTLGYFYYVGIMEKMPF